MENETGITGGSMTKDDKNRLEKFRKKHERWKVTKINMSLLNTCEIDFLLDLIDRHEEQMIDLQISLRREEV